MSSFFFFSLNAINAENTVCLECQQVLYVGHILLFIAPVQVTGIILSFKCLWVCRGI